MSDLTCPDGLGEQGRRLWADFTGEWEWNPDELANLAEACSVADQIQGLKDALAGQKVSVEGSRGQPVLNPLIPELRQQQALLSRLLARLVFPAEGPGESKSQMGSRLAMQRWHGERRK